MGFSLNTLFFGWWLTRQMWIAVGQSYPKPFISVSPSEMVAMGDNATIQCESSYQNAEFYLKKQGVSQHFRTLGIQMTKQYKAIFPILHARQSDAGIYWCTYCTRTHCDQQSDPSSRVYINITDPSLSKPSITLRPRDQIAPGLNVTIECHGWQHGHVFAVFKSRDLIVSQTAEPDTDVIEFPLFMVTPEDTRSYTCRYHRKGYPFVWSEPSDPVEMVFLKRQSYAKPSISMSPSEMVALGGNVTIQCETGHPHAIFYLMKQGVSLPHILGIQKTEQHKAVFQVLNARQSNGGIYWCTYCIKTDCEQQSNPSERVYINVTDSSFSKPSIKMRPSDQIVPSLNVTIECHGWQHGLIFAVFKSRDLVASQITEPDADIVEFPFFTVSLEDSGSYTCRYHRKGYPFVWSEPSDPVEFDFLRASPAVVETNIRLGVASLVLFAMILIVAEAIYSWKKEALIFPD